MPIRTTLDGTPRAIVISPIGCTLEAPGVRGIVVELPALSSGQEGGAGISRSVGGAIDNRLAAAMSGAGVNSPVAFDISVDNPSAGLAIASTTRGAGAGAMVLTVPSRANMGCAALYTDAAGHSHWIMPVVEAAAPGIRFRLPVPSKAPAPPESNGGVERGLVTKGMRALVRIFAWSTDGLVGPASVKLATMWETERRPYALRSLPFGSAGKFDAAVLAQGRSLLFIHGTFSTCYGTFQSLPQSVVDALLDRYEGRIFGFDHPTMHVSPEENARELLRMLPQGTTLDLDVVTHSRGGLVGRELAENVGVNGAEGRRAVVHTAVLVASPNRGTILTNGDHGIAMLDRYTNLLTNAPDDVFTISMEAVFSAIKLVYRGFFRALPGIRCMIPEGEYLSAVNRRSSSTIYRAVGSRFEPKGDGVLPELALGAVGGFMRDVFEEDSDGVVPTTGSYRWSSTVAEEGRLVFEPSDQIHHCNYFGAELLGEKLLQWLAP